MYGEAFVVKEMRSRLRKKSLIFFGALYLGILGLISLVAYLSYVEDVQRWTGYRAYYFAQGPNISAIFERYVFGWYDAIMITQYILFAFGVLIVSGSVAREYERKTIDFISTLPMSPYEIAVGKLIGAPMLVYFGVLISIPVTMIAVVVGVVPFAHWLINYLVLIGSGVAALSLGLFASSVSKATTRASGAALGLIGFVLLSSTTVPIGGPLGMDAFANVASYIGFASPFHYLLKPDHRFWEYCHVMFFGIKINGLILSLVYYVVIMLVCLNGAARKIADRAKPVLSKPQALALFGFIVFLFFGSLWPYRAINYPDDFAYFDIRWYIAFSAAFCAGLLILTAYALMPNYYATRWWLRHGKSYDLKTRLTHDRNPIWILMLMCVGLVAVFYFITGYRLWGVIEKYPNYWYRGYISVSIPMGFAVVAAASTLVMAVLQWFSLIFKRYAMAVGFTVGVFIVVTVLSLILHWAVMVATGSGRSADDSYMFFQILNPFAGFVTITEFDRWESFLIAHVITYISLAGLVSFLIRQRLKKMTAEL